ncbi:hypothetical protein D3C80_2169720 [compost metagenome]
MVSAMLTMMKAATSKGVSTMGWPFFSSTTEPSASISPSITRCTNCVRLMVQNR